MNKRTIMALVTVVLSASTLKAQTRSSQVPHTPEELQKLWTTKGGRFGWVPGQARVGEEFTDYRITEKTLAQALIEELPKLYPEVQYGVLHALLPDGKTKAVIASFELTEIGEKDNEGADASVLEHGQIVINPRSYEDYSRTAVRVKTRDASGQEIRACWAIYFKSASANDYERYAAALKSAMKINEEMAKKIPSLAALYAPATKHGYSAEFRYDDYKPWLNWAPPKEQGSRPLQPAAKLAR